MPLAAGRLARSPPCFEVKLKGKVSLGLGLGLGFYKRYKRIADNPIN